MSLLLRSPLDIQEVAERCKHYYDILESLKFKNTCSSLCFTNDKYRKIMELYIFSSNLLCAYQHYFFIEYFLHSPGLDKSFIKKDLSKSRRKSRKIAKEFLEMIQNNIVTMNRLHEEAKTESRGVCKDK